MTQATEKSSRWDLEVGAAKTTALFEPADAPLENSLLILAHGAGGHFEHANISREAQLFRSLGLDIIRFNFIYRAEGRRYPDPMPRLLECYRAVADTARERYRPRHLFLGGHSLGGRTTSVLVAEGFPCDGLILLAYPLHPPGKAEQLRSAHLAKIGAPVLCFNGTRDDFCNQELMQRTIATLPPTWTMHWLEDADHSFRVPKKSGRTQADVLGEIHATAREWLAHILRPQSRKSF